MIGTVLVADDSPTIQKKASGILTGEGLEVVTVSNGVAAVKKMSTVKPNIVLADCSMPGKDGYEVCEFVKNSPELSRIPVLLIVSDLEPYDEERGTRARADGLVTKPFVPDDLISTVSSFLNKAAAAVAAAAEPPPSPELPPPPVPEYFLDTVPEMPDIDDPSPAAPRFGAVPQGTAFSQALQNEDLMGPAGQPEPPDAAPTETPMEDVQSYPQELEATPEYFLKPTEAGDAAGETNLESAHDVPPIFSYDLEPPHLTAEPVLTEGPGKTEPPAPQRPHAERTMMFRSPLHIAEPLLHDELAPPAPVMPPHPVEPEVDAAEPAFSASTLESYSLDEAAAGHVHFPLREETSAEVAEYAGGPVVESTPAGAAEGHFAEVPSELATPPVDAHPMMVEEAPARVPALDEEAPAVEPVAAIVEPPPAGEEQPAPPVEQSAAPEQAAAPLEEPLVPIEEALIIAEPAPPPVEEPAPVAAQPEEPSPVIEPPEEPPPVIEPAGQPPPVIEPPAEPPSEEPPPVEEAAAPPVAPEEPPAAAVEPAPESSAEIIWEADAAVAPAPLHEPAPGPQPPVMDQELLRSIVHKVVARMAPPVLSSAVVEEIEEGLIQEISADLAGSPGSSAGPRNE